MNDMFDSMYTNHLAELQTWRSVSQLRNSHIELNWDWFTVYLRTADLIVLYQALVEWFEGDGEPAAVYTVWMGEERLTLPAADLDAFYELVTAAVQKLSRRTVRWIDVPMRVEPHQPELHNGISYFSIN